MPTNRDDDPGRPADSRGRPAPGAQRAPPVRRWPAVLALVVGLALVAGFGLRGWSQWQYAQRVERGEIRVESLRGWMTLPHVASVHGVPEAALRAAIGAPPTGHDTRSLRQWFDATGVEPLAGRQALEAVILERGRKPPPVRP
jgi:hypothetical protein